MLEKIEERQTLIYAVTIVVAIIFAQWISPQLQNHLQVAITPALAGLMFAMFAQIPFLQWQESLKARRFFLLLLISNYIAVPLIVWGLLKILMPDTTLIIGILLVLLTPCIDYVVVFTKLGKGDASLMLSATPLLFITQIILLPLYLSLFLGSEILSILAIQPLIETFVYMIVLPFIFALLLQWWAQKSPLGAKLHQSSAWLPVPLMALVLFLIIATQMPLIWQNRTLLIQLIPIYISFMVLTALISYGLGKWRKLPAIQIRTLIYSSGTRNSLAVLPFAFALPPAIQGLVAATIVTQTLVELIGELVYTQITPKIH
ncbi:arsenic resistance protein [Ignatzschineria larvae DSM 13226]|uniref:Arsenic resistance protein n=1 Tax=Ignatzschineria larvae DSM 13226 TaxID=1111732 RepID=A0ABZ3C0Q4_9GAMM|nr:arsenic resistance protein [Ignatzschineria larvae]